jgi:peroxiredoxin (alkyl hydroperoxide reductase subunit C)
MGVLAAGTSAPTFKLARADGDEFTQEDLLGTTTVLVFYPFAFSSVCNDQLTLYEEVLDEFSARGATLYAISTDARWSQAAFREKLGSSIRQLSDFEPKGATARAFGVLSDGGFTQRALVIVDPEGVVKWSYLPSPGDLPGANLIFDGLAS